MEKTQCLQQGDILKSDPNINSEDNQQRRRSQVKEGALSSSLNRHPALSSSLEHLYEIVKL